MHRLTLRQLKKHLNIRSLDDLPEEWLDFVTAVSDAYVDSDNDRALLEHSIELSSQELTTRNKELRDDIVKREETEKALRTSQVELEEQKKLFENLVAVARASTQRLTLDDTLRNVLNVAISLTGAQNSSLFLIGPQGNVTHSIRSDAFNVGIYSDNSSEVMTTGLANWVYEHKELALIGNTREDSRWKWIEGVDYQPLSALCLPISHGEILLGILTLTHHQENYFGDNDAILMQSAADQMALALSNAQIYDQQTRLAEQQIALYYFLQSLGDLLDKKQIAEMACKLVVELTSWTAAVLFQPTADGKDLKVIGLFGNTLLNIGDQIPLVKGITGRAWKLGKTQYVEDALNDPDYHGISTEMPPHGQMSIPLKRSDAMLGILSVNLPSGNRFNKDDVILTESLAEAITISLDKATAYEEMNLAKELAETANLAKTEFVSIVSHELKNPMTSIKGFTDLLLVQAAGPLNEQQKQFLRTVKINISRMQTLVSDLTDIAQIESGHFHLELKESVLNPIIADVLQAIDSQIQAKEQTIELVLDADLPTVLVDQNRVMQILTNLISNANKYTPEKGVIQIGVCPNYEKQVIQISVKDNGIGMTEEDQAKLFQKFFRSADEEARKSTGTGLGLNITKNLVELQGGKIWFDSKFREGTTFHFTVPIALVKVRK